ncbi:hypothetical protein OIU78_030447 [Salix suchowensis]|nr:hypothetical protein OIU78_030447 [Salix suchowensis]
MATRKEPATQKTTATPPQPNVRPAPSPPRTQQSWADKVRVSDSTTRFKLQQLARQPTGSKLVIPANILLENTDQWTRSMVGFFPGYKMPFHAAKSIAKRAWAGHGLEQVMTMEAGYLVFRFKSETDMQGVIAKGPWMFGGKHIALQQWHPQLKFERNQIKAMPVLIRLYGLPFPLWSHEGLSRAASMVGKPLSCDEPTYRSTRLDYARMCVEVIADDEFVHSFEIETPLTTEPCTVRVEYEWKPAHCMECKTFGHNCRANSGTKETKDGNNNEELGHRTIAPDTNPKPPHQTTHQTTKESIQHQHIIHTTHKIQNANPNTSTISPKATHSFTDPTTTAQLDEPALTTTTNHRKKGKEPQDDNQPMDNVIHPPISKEPVPKNATPSHNSSQSTRNIVLTTKTNSLNPPQQSHPHTSHQTTKQSLSSKKHIPPNPDTEEDSHEDATDSDQDNGEKHQRPAEQLACLEKRMDSLQSRTKIQEDDDLREVSSARRETSPLPAQKASPPQPSTVRKKGGKKKKGATGL